MEEDSEESHSLMCENKTTNSSWKGQDFLLLILGVFISFGVGAEIHLPGLVTQLICCDSGEDRATERLMGVALYAPMGVTALVGTFTLDKLKVKRTALLSLYGSSITSFLCAIIGEYHIVTISRAVVGAYLGLNLAVYRSLILERASSQQTYLTISLCSSLAFSCGGAWIPTLGYFLLDSVGWRNFLVLTSLPVFLPAIFILHFFNFEVAQLDDQAIYHQLQSDAESISMRVKKVPDIKARLIKLCMFNFTVCYQDWGTILLFPTLLQQYNMSQTGGSYCNATVRGPEFLFVALVNGAVLVGKSSENLFSGLVIWQFISASLAAATLASFTAIFLNQSTFVIIFFMSCVVKSASGFNILSIENVSYDKRYFGTRHLPLASAMIQGAGFIGGVLGATVVSMVTPQIALLCALVISGVEMLTTFSMKEGNQKGKS